MYQRITILGHLGKDPEMKYIPSGTAVTKMSVATNRKWIGNDGQRQEETTWFTVEAWGKQAESCNTYLHKGAKVLVEGRMKPDESGNPRTFNYKDGSPGARFEITASNVKFVETNREKQTPHVQPSNDSPFDGI